MNVDGSAYSNDLLLTTYKADVNSKADSGAVYLIKNIDGLSGAKDLVNLNNFDVRWNGGAATDSLGYTIGSGLGVQLVNVDGSAYANDLLLAAVNADVNGLTDNGVVYLIKGIDGLSGVKDLSDLGNFDVCWNGSVASDKLGSTDYYGGNAGLGVQLVFD
ncbi:MAG: hypothetical protein NTY48_03095 [Candidatus Diapherotrites archaeon]|nr:hypothetical protein [Candidatus Diapherotrites archaeon]